MNAGDKAILEQVRKSAKQTAMTMERDAAILEQLAELQDLVAAKTNISPAAREGVRRLSLLLRVMAKGMADNEKGARDIVAFAGEQLEKEGAML